VANDFLDIGARKETNGCGFVWNQQHALAPAITVLFYHLDTVSLLKRELVLVATYVPVCCQSFLTKKRQKEKRKVGFLE